MPDLKQLLREAAAQGATKEQLDVIYNTYQEKVKKKDQPISQGFGIGLEPSQPYRPSVLMPGVEPVYGEVPKKKESKFAYNPQSFSQSIKALKDYSKGKTKDIQDFADPRLNELWQQSKQNASQTGSDPVADFATAVLDTASDLVPVRIKNAWNKGAIQGNQAAIIGTAEGQLTPEQISELSLLERQYLEIPQSEEEKKFSEGGFSWLFSNPVQGSKFIGEILASSLSSQLSASKRTIPAGVATGAVAGSIIPGIGTLAGAATGATAGMVTSTLSIETSQKVLEALKEAGFDTTDEESLARGLSNRDLVEKAREKGLKRGVPIMIMDAATAGLGSKLLLGSGSKLAKGLGAMGIEAAGGAGGEFLAQVSAGEKIRPTDIGLEAIAEIGAGAPSLITETASRLVSRDKTSASNENIAKSIAIDPKNGAQDAVRNLDNQLQEGRITEDEYNEGIAFVEKSEKAKDKVPADLNDDVKAEAIILVDKKDDLLTEIVELEKQKETLDDAFHKPIDDQIAEKQTQLETINTQIQDAVQKQTAGQVPVQPEAQVGGEVAQGEPQAEPQALAEGVQEKITIGVAPFREINVTSLDQDADLRSTPEYKNYVKNIARISKSLGLKVDQSAETWGGYVDTETGRPVQEVSNMLQIKATPEEARVLAAILGKTAPEMQDSVLVGSFNENGSGAEHTIRTGSFENANKAIEFLKKNGLEYFTIDKNTGDIIILDLDGSAADNIINFNNDLNENGINTEHTAYGVEAEFVGRDDYDGILAEQGRKIAEERGIDIDAIVKSATERFQKTRKQKVEPEPEAEVVVLEEQTPKDIASKIRGLKVTLGKGALQSNIAGLPIALYNSVVEFVATSVEAGSTIAEAIKKAIDKFNLNKVKGFDKDELTRNIEEIATPVKSKSVKDIDVNKIRTQDRPGKRISKGLSVKTVNKEKSVEESEDLSIEYVKNNAPKVFISNAEKIARYPLVSGVKKFGEIKTESEAQEVYDIFVRQVADNLKYLTGEYNQEFRDIATLWYDGANMLANKLSEQYGVSSEQAAGIIAAMSPQKDWYMNVRLAELVMMAYKQNAVLTNDMISKQVEIAKEGEKPFLKAVREAKKALSESRTKANIEKSIDAQKKYNSNKEKSDKVIEWLKSYVGKDINSVPESVQPYIVRLHNELNNSKDFNILRPDGEVLEIARTKEGEVKKIAWGSYSEIGKAVSIYNNGSQENITKSLGEMHKIRNFYNNIIDPMSKDGDVTIDTHAVAAALLQPLSGNSKAVGENFGTGTSNSSPLGIKGLYYAYSDAYALAAKELKLLPRQVQSITWEAVRGLFTDTFKRNVAEVKKINDIWKNYENGKITIEQTRRLINESAGGVKDPTWAKPVLSEPEGGVESRPVRRGSGVSRPDAVGEPSAVRVAAKSLRNLKIDLGKGAAQSNIAGLPIALYNSVIEFIATSIEAGATVSEAIKKAIDKFKLNDVKSFDEAELKFIISESVGESEPTGIIKRPAGKLAKVREGLAKVFGRGEKEVGRAIKPEEFAEFEEVPSDKGKELLLRSLEAPQRIEAKAKAAQGAVNNYYNRLRRALTSTKFDIQKALDKAGTSAGQLARAAMENIKGSTAVASLFSTETNLKIFKKLSFAPNVKMKLMENGKPVDSVWSERQLFDVVLDAKRIISIDARIRDKFSELVQLSRKLKDGVKNNTLNKEQRQELVNKISTLKEYLLRRKSLLVKGPNANVQMIGYQDSNFEYTDNEIDLIKEDYEPLQYKHTDNKTMADAEAILNEIKTQHPELYKKLDDLSFEYNDRFRDLLKLNYEEGLIDKETYDELFSYNYIPTKFIQHFIENELAADNPSRAKKLSASIKNLTGGSEEDVITNYQAILDLYAHSTHRKLFQNRASIYLQKALGDIDKSRFGNQEFYVQKPSGKDKYGKPKYEAPPKGHDYIKYYENGVEKRIIAPQQFVDIWEDSEFQVNPWIDSAMNFLSRLSLVNFIKGVFTKYSPVFGATQILMDAPQALIASKAYPDFFLGSVLLASDYASVAKDVKSAIKGKPTPLFLEAVNAGIFSDFLSTENDLIKGQSFTNYDGSSNIKNQVKYILGRLSRGIDKTLESIGKFNEATEYATRLAVYTRMKKNLISDFKKANNGAEPTGQALKDIQLLAANEGRRIVDFSSAGGLAKQGNKLLAYLNSGIQVFVSAARGLKNNPYKAGLMITEIGFAGAALLAYSLGDLGGSEEDKRKRYKEYKKRSKYERESYFLFWTGDPERPFARLQKPPLFRGLINMFEQGYLNATRGDDFNQEEMWSAFQRDIPFGNPLSEAVRNPMVNAAFKYGMNYDQFRKERIVKDEEKTWDYAEVKGASKFYRNIGKLSKEYGIAGEEGISPMRMQAAVESFTGDPSKNTFASLLDISGKTLLYLRDGDTKVFEERFKGGNPALDLFEASGLQGKLFSKKLDYDASFAEELEKDEKDEYTKNLLINSDLKELRETYKTMDKAYEPIKEYLLDKIKSKDITPEYASSLGKKQEKLFSIKDKNLPEFYDEIFYANKNERKAKILNHYTSGLNDSEAIKIYQQVIDLGLASAEAANMAAQLRNSKKGKNEK